MHDQKQLHEIALDYPWFMFTGEEIAELCNVSQNVVWRVKTLSDSPFFLNKCRPEWFLEWMRLHPNFQLTKEYVPSPDRVPAKNPAKAKSDAAREKPLAPASANPTNTTFPVILATKTRPRLRMLTASTMPVVAVIINKSAGSGP